MPLPASGPISFNDINVELGVAGTTQASLGQASYRTLAGVASGQISMSNFYGKANQFTLTISTNQTNVNLASLATANGWNGASRLVVTINSGVYVSSNNTATPALTVSGSFPGGVELTNNGFIVGMGGAGGGGNGWVGTAGYAGGNALTVSSAITINNASGTIAGGGGGGGSAITVGIYNGEGGVDNFGGGGGGGGRSSAAANSAGGPGVGAGPLGGAAGAAGTVSSAGGGGKTAFANGYGGTGGGWGSAGATGSNQRASGTVAYSYGPHGGGAGGSSVVGNSNITWTAFGTRLGSIS